MSPRLQHPLHLGQDGPCIWNVHEQGVAVDDIEGLVLEGKIRRRACLGKRIAMPTGRGGGASHLDLGLLHVDAVQLSGFHCICEPYRDRSRTTPEIEQAEPGLEVWEQMSGIVPRVLAVEHLLELVVVAHRVGGRGDIRGFVVGHRLCLLSPPRQSVPHPVLISGYRVPALALIFGKYSSTWPRPVDSGTTRGPKHRRSRSSRCGHCGRSTNRPALHDFVALACRAQGRLKYASARQAARASS